MCHSCCDAITVDPVMPDCNPMNMVIGSVNYRRTDPETRIVVLIFNISTMECLLRRTS